MGRRHRPPASGGRSVANLGAAWPYLLGAAAVWILAVDALPDAFGRLAPTTVRRGPAGRGRVALTFDDGPDPTVTPRLLEVLSAAGVRATFFVVLARARGAPQVLERMGKDGHEVALHALAHRHAWLWSPWGAGRAVRQGWAELDRLTGGRAVPYFRPPWGSANLGQLWAARRLGLTTVLWEVAPGDWQRDLAAAELIRRVMARVRDGDIVDLHDAGGAAGAPDRTVGALPELIAQLRRCGLEPVTVGELLSAGREPVSWGVRLWEVWEGLFSRAGHLVPIGREGLFSIGLRAYRGPVLTSPLGETIRPGDPAGEIHLGNLAISRLAGDVREAFRVRRMLNDSLDELADRVAAGEFGGVRVFFGTTLLGRAARHVGLHAEPLPKTAGVRLNAFYMGLLARIYQPRTARHRGPQPEATLCWVSRQELLERHRRRERPFHAG
jgi:peptidoglycan/xylan/chitin deacetylase (PgdA/CDA1 family)